MKLCTDCFFCKKIEDGRPLCPRHFKCTRFRSRDLVTGAPVEAFCAIERRDRYDGSSCGTEGKFFRCTITKLD